ncbi:alpha/beta hydrolase [Kribbella sandramycini]|uniref:Alpha/beta hydrolase n=1 Tax=Kribbella sandramycini TaxID=60450 RepID=A0A7Y4P0S9_9ACTN|nr:alpha/beta hydrolase [Kribbella sandramycini]MBB6571104.1 pimeloyl-ACP methyl ester carboxylesterase [Kribbella sandramycini]NOL43487.1 alpha/beta hydrolase [Kribbella sandramycini]
MKIRRVLAAAASVLITLTGATTAVATHKPEPKPTVVLIHGAFADGGSWSEVTKKLQRDGYTVVAPAVPLRSIATDTEYLTGVLAGIPGPKVLVGHSYGGALITQLAGTPGVKSLVYVAAFVPQKGETIGALNAQFPGSEINEKTTNAISYPGGVDLVMKPDAFRWVFAADLPTRQADVLGAAQRPVSASVFTETVPNSAPAALPKYAVIAGKDRAIAPAGERFMAKRANAKIVEAPGASHLVMLSEPSLVTRTIEQAAR